MKKAEVSLAKAQARVEFDDVKISPEKLVTAIDQLGFKAKLLQVNPSRAENTDRRSGLDSPLR